ncbi:MAG: response regulator transcription factor [Ruminiclostridium sp.]|nr:response regulator transcription factor [Ruminiclostridium sp.]
MKKIRILLADDQKLFYSGLKTVLDLEKDLEVVGTAENGEEVITMAASLNPDVILLDIRMPVMNGVQCIKTIKSMLHEVKIIMLTTFDDEAYILDALANGANGYLLKDIEVEKLLEAIHDVYADKMIIPPDVAEKLAFALSRIKTAPPSSKLFSELSEREREIARMMVQGFTSRQISSALYISEGTVRNYISTIYDKIEIHDRTKAVLFLKENGIG